MISKYRRIIRGALAVFDELESKVDFLVVDGVVAGSFSGISEVEILKEQIEMGYQYFFAVGKRSVRVRLELDCSFSKAASDKSEDKYITTDSSNKLLAADSNSKIEKSPMVALAVENRIQAS